MPPSTQGLWPMRGDGSGVWELITREGHPQGRDGGVGKAVTGASHRAAWAVFLGL